MASSRKYLDVVVIPMPVVGEKRNLAKEAGKEEARIKGQVMWQKTTRYQAGTLRCVATVD